MHLEILSLIGAFLSFYAYRVERSSKKEHKKPICDINDKISCTKAFTSKWGKTFGVQNSLCGIIFYILILILSAYDLTKIIFYLSIISVLISIYLTYILYFKVRSLCLVCILIYAINILLVIFSYLLLR